MLFACGALSGVQSITPFRLPRFRGEPWLYRSSSGFATTFGWRTTLPSPPPSEPARRYCASPLSRMMCALSGARRDGGFMAPSNCLETPCLDWAAGWCFSGEARRNSFQSWSWTPSPPRCSGTGDTERRKSQPIPRLKALLAKRGVPVRASVPGFSTSRGRSGISPQSRSAFSRPTAGPPWRAPLRPLSRLQGKSSAANGRTGARRRGEFIRSVAPAEQPRLGVWLRPPLDAGGERGAAQARGFHR